MSKQIAKKSGGKPAKRGAASGALAKRPAGELEPLKQVPPEEAKIRDWLERFDNLPKKRKNAAIRANPEVLGYLYGGRVTTGDLLIGPLAAEHGGDRDEGEFTFLTVLKPLRDKLVKEYEIKTGAEFMLLDALVMSYYQYIRAASNLHSYTAYGKSYNYETLVRYAQAYLARANEMFLRNLEALRQMKAAPFVIKIEQAGQVNVGEKQVNVSGRPDPGSADVLLDRGAGEMLTPSATGSSPPALPEPHDGA